MPAPVREVARVGRHERRPQHTFQLQHLPWQIQPFLLAPVLPGETLKNVMMQARVVTDPIKNPLVGWWLEYFFFYVKHRDMNVRDDLEGMVLDVDWDPSPVDDAAADAKYYFAGNGINWAKHCLERVVEEFFRNEGESWNGFLLDGMPVAQITGNSWLDSVVPAADMMSEDVDIPLDATAETVQASDIEAGMRQWELMRQMNLTDMSYEDWLGSFGVKRARVETHRPELVRFVRQWTYPTNTVDPATGVPASACSWAIAERADKARFFNEPGFIFGVTVARPKVYLAAQAGSASWFLRNAFTWLPAVLSNDPSSSLHLIADGTGPYQTGADAGGYWVDVRDLFVHGDQFLNFATNTAAKSLVPLPTTALQKRYVTVLADVQALFTGTTPPSLVRQDGIVSLGIMGNQRDTTPTRSVVLG